MRRKNKEYLRVRTEKFIKKAQKVHGDKYDYSKVDYVDIHTKVIIGCPDEHGDFEQTPNAHRNGSGCPRCAWNHKMSTEAFIKKAQKVHGYKYDYSKVGYLNKGAKTKVIIICPEHGEFDHEVRTHLRGCGCLKCPWRQKFIERAKKVHGDKYDYSKVNYVDIDTKVIITCPEHGDFEQTPSSHLKGHQNCRKCSKYLRQLRFIKQAQKVHGDKYDYSKVDFVGVHTKVIITCPEHGDFDQMPSGHLRMGCKRCGINNRTTSTEAFIKRARKVHGDKYDYSKVEFVRVDQNITIICPEHGDFEQTPKCHYEGKSCQRCGGNHRKSTEEFIQQARKVHGDKYDYSKVEFISGTIKVIIGCPEHGDFEQEARNHLRGSSCQRCANKAEGRIAIYLNERYILHRSFKIEDRYFDFYLPEYNLIIERDGQQHYRNVDLFAHGDKDYLAKQKVNDLYKTQLAKKHGYKISRIPYWLTPDQEEQEIANILAGNPTYPDVPDPSERETKPLPGIFLPQPTNNYLSFVREC